MARRTKRGNAPAEEPTVPVSAPAEEQPITDVAVGDAVDAAPTAQLEAEPTTPASPSSTEDLLASLPSGSRVAFTRGDPDRFVVHRGPGVAQHGEGKTLARAIRTVGAKHEHALDENGKQTPRMHLVDEAGEVIPPEE